MENTVAHSELIESLEKTHCQRQAYLSMRHQRPWLNPHACLCDFGGAAAIRCQGFDISAIKERVEIPLILASGKRVASVSVSRFVMHSVFAGADVVALVEPSKA